MDNWFDVFDWKGDFTLGKDSISIFAYFQFSRKFTKLQKSKERKKERIHVLNVKFWMLFLILEFRDYYHLSVSKHS